ncbi:hypothetical protein E2C01_009867 [Portunus trituberculatus]|uniref:Uncharacterized protein n=1 Tax=Portunus trituberculatus TaxID=210409 RepID=A0A5B7D6V8_PORTR|nr:hypothetical protein [Portunus trituberculatus]
MLPAGSLSFVSREVEMGREGGKEWGDIIKDETAVPIRSGAASRLTLRGTSPSSRHHNLQHKF